MLFRMDFIPKDGIGPEDAEARIQYFLLALRENGQILEDFELIQNRRYAAVFASYSRKHPGDSLHLQAPVAGDVYLL